MSLFGFFNGGADLLPESAASRIAADSRSVIVDVRTPGEFEEGHVKGALLLPSGCPDEKIEAALPDKNAAVRRLKAAGYTSVFNIGGIANRGFTKTFPLVR